MSIRQMTAVWSDAPYDGGALIVMLALADWADDVGYCFPKVPAIAKKSRLTERQVHNILRAFRRDGTLSVDRGGGRGVPNRYYINPEKFSLKSVSLKLETKTLKSKTDNPEICSSGKMGTFHSESIGCGEKRRGNRHYPSIEPSTLSSGPAGSEENTAVCTALRTVWDYYLQRLTRAQNYASSLLTVKKKDWLDCVSVWRLPRAEPSITQSS